MYFFFNVFFKFLCVRGFLLYTLYIKLPHKYKSHGVRSGDKQSLATEPPNTSLAVTIELPTVCAFADLSNRTSFRSLLTKEK
jgi:hypothetical protein